MSAHGFTRYRALQAAVSRIRCSSPLHDRGQHWLMPEAALVWQIWVQALTDCFGSAGCPLIYRDSAKRTAMKGVIMKPDGTEVNALELLGIDASWAYKQVIEALAFKEAA